MRELRREIDIDAPPAVVWAVLTDTRSYSEWNPFMPHLAGELREGAKLEVRIEPPGGRAMTFKPASTRLFRPQRESAARAGNWLEHRDRGHLRGVERGR